MKYFIPVASNIWTDYVFGFIWRVYFKKISSYADLMPTMITVSFILL